MLDLPFLAALHAFQEGADGCDFSFRFQEFSISICELNVTQLPRLKPRSPGDTGQIQCQSDKYISFNHVYQFILHFKSRYYKNLPEKNFCSPLGGGLHLNYTWQDHKSDLLTIKVYDTYPPWSATNVSASSLGNNTFLGEKMSVLGMLSSSPRYLRW